MKKIISLLMVFTLVLVGCGGDDEYVSPIDNGVLTVGSECDYAPYNWTTTEENASEYAVQIEGSNSYCDGYDMMVANYLADWFDVELEVKKITWDGLIPALQSGEIDVVIAGMSPTDERKETIDFTDAYYSDEPEMVIVVNSDSSYANATSLNDFEGAIISAQQGTIQDGLIEQIPGVEHGSALPDYASLIQATASGAIDGYVAEIVVAEEQAAANDNLIVVYFDEGEGFILDEGDTTTAIGVAKGHDQFVSDINEALAELETEIREEWMNESKKASGEEE